MSTVLLLHLDTNFADSLGLHSTTPQGAITNDPATFKFGSGSLYVPYDVSGAGANLNISTSTDFAFGLGDYTIDFWFRFNGYQPAWTTLWQMNTANEAGTLNIYLHHYNQTLIVGGGLSAGPGVAITGTTVITNDIWHHVALTRSSTGLRLFLDGVQEGSTYVPASPNPIENMTVLAGGINLGIGMEGWIDEVRVLKGTAAWIANFTPPTAAYLDAATITTLSPAVGHIDFALSTSTVGGAWTYRLIPPSASLGLSHENVQELGGADYRSYPPLVIVTHREVAPIVHYGDKHIRRSGDDYAVAMAHLLPVGIAWPREASSVLMKTVRGLAQIFGFVDRRAADLLEIESDPRTTIEMLSDWERNWGLPDLCFIGVGQSLDQRRKFLILKMTLEGAQSREFFIWVCAQLGFNVAITEFAPFMCGVSAVGDTRQNDLSQNLFSGNLLA